MLKYKWDQFQKIDMFSFVMWLEYLKDSSIIPEFIFPEVLENKSFLSSLPKKSNVFSLYLFV